MSNVEKRTVMKPLRPNGCETIIPVGSTLQCVGGQLYEIVFAPTDEIMAKEAGNVNLGLLLEGLSFLFSENEIKDKTIAA